MTDLSTAARVHRFRDSVAFHVEGPNATETLYLSPDLAQRLGDELIRFARDCRAVKFTRSTLATVDLEDEPGRCEVCLKPFMELSGGVQGCPVHGIRGKA